MLTYVYVCALVSCGVERRVTSWAQFQSGIYSGFCSLLLQSFCSWPRHLWDAWISSKSRHDWSRGGSSEPLPFMTEFSEHGQTLTGFDILWLIQALYMIDARLIPRSGCDLTLLLTYFRICRTSTTNCQSMCGTPELVTKARGWTASPLSKGFGQHPFAPCFPSLQNFQLFICTTSVVLLVWHRLLNTLSLVLVLCPRLIFGWYEAWNTYVVYMPSIVIHFHWLLGPQSSIFSFLWWASLIGPLPPKKSSFVQSQNIYRSPGSVSTLMKWFIFFKKWI
jgi:hypothetical protein